MPGQAVSSVLLEPTVGRTSETRRRRRRAACGARPDGLAARPAEVRQGPSVEMGVVRSEEERSAQKKATGRLGNTDEDFRSSTGRVNVGSSDRSRASEREATQSECHTVHVD